MKYAYHITLIYYFRLYDQGSFHNNRRVIIMTCATFVLKLFTENKQLESNSFAGQH